MKFRKPLGALAAASALVLLAACASTDDGGSTDDGELTTVTLRHSWIPDDLMLPIATAKALGYYEEVGIDLQDQVGDGGSTAVKLVANGDVMIGTGEAANVLIGRSNGLDVINFATQNQWTSTAFVSLKETGVEDWADLRGKRISINFASSAYAALQAALELEGIGLDEVELINLPPGTDLASALPGGEIDVATVFVGNIAAVDYQDDLNVLPFTEAGVNWPSTGYFVKESFLDDPDNVDLLTRWLGATLRGMQYALDDPDAAAELMAGLYPDVDAAGVAAKFRLSQPYMVGDLGGDPLGWQNAAAWENEAEMLFGAELITTEVDADASFTNEIVEAVAAE